MSVQAGIWNFDGHPVDRDAIESYSRRLGKHGPDGESTFFDGCIAMLYRPFHTTSESRLERQPYISAAGNIITWDGRLDNGEELAAQLTDRPSTMVTDVSMVAAAFDRWGSDCFAKFIGDWAFAGWNRKERTLTLAIDYMAIKHLHYYLKGEKLTWCTDLKALVLESEDQFDLDDEYIAGYLACNPSPGHTPYLQIRSVEPGHFVRIHAGQVASSAHFKFKPRLKIRYKTDAEYEEHFRHVFRQAVRRRLRSDAPILADLSGGLDSSSIVCMADDIVARQGCEASHVDTYSTFDLGEPDGDDLHYLNIVERKRGRTGYHVDLAQFPNSILPDTTSFAVLPAALNASLEVQTDYEKLCAAGGYRIRLSGLGGDEMLGGVPDPSPELADLIVQMRLLRFVRRTLIWSFQKRRPWLYLVLRTCALLSPAQIRARLTAEGKVAAWIARRFSKDFNLPLRQLGPLQRFGFWLPSRQWCAQTVAALSCLMAARPLGTSDEVWYPYLDQNLIEFLVAIPRDQLIRPGERRSLMRRALKDLVPEEILSRRTKGTASRRPILAFSERWESLASAFDSSLAVNAGYMDQAALRNAMLLAKNGSAPELVRLLQALSLEIWLQGAVSRHLLRIPRGSCKRPQTLFTTPLDRSSQWKPST